MSMHDTPSASTHHIGGPVGRILVAIDHFSRFSGLAVGQFYLFCAAITGYEVIARYVFHSPTQWAFEMVMTLCAITWLVSGGYVTLNKRHIAITVLKQYTSQRLQWWLDLFVYCLGFVALYMLTESCLDAAMEAIIRVERAGSAFDSPEPTIVKTILCFGAFLYATQLVVHILRHLESFWARAAVGAIAVACLIRLIGLIMQTAFGDNVVMTTVDAVFSVLQPIGSFGQSINIRSIPIADVTIVIVIALFVLMATGMSLGIVTMAVSLAVALLYFGPKGLFLVSSNVYGLLEAYPLVAVPLFVLMSSILERSGLAKDLFDAMSIFAGNLRGGVAVQTTAVAVVLAAMTGIMGGEIVMLGLVALPQMLRLGYNRKLALGLICAAGSLATLIPPSIIMIVYGLAAKVALGDLFLAGFLPGLLLASLYVIYTLILCHLRPDYAPVASEVFGGEEKPKMSRDRLVAVFAALSVIGGVMGSIYAGIASVTEAAGVGVVGALAVSALRRKCTWDMIQGVVRQTMVTVGTIIWLVMGAVSLVGIYNIIGGASFLKGVFTGLDVSPWLIILLMMAILVVLGTFMEWIAIVFITVPIFAPVVVDLAPAMGMDPDYIAIWFGVLFVMNMQIYFLSPPFGPACFWLKSVTPKDVTLQEIFGAVLPFIALQITGLILVMVFPEIALFLPTLLK